MTDQQLNALKRTACQWVLAEHPYLHDNTKTDADWARWYDDVQEGKIDFDEPAIDEEETRPAIVPFTSPKTTRAGTKPHCFIMYCQLWSQRYASCGRKNHAYSALQPPREREGA